MPRYRSRFELKVHLGLLTIIVLLLIVNSVSTYILFTARNTQEMAAVSRFEGAAYGIASRLHELYPQSLAAERAEQLKREYQLTGLTVIRSRPVEDSPSARRRWFASLAKELPATRLPELAEQLIEAPYRTITRGKEDQFYFVWPASIWEGEHLIVLSAELPDLAFVEDARKVSMFVSLVSLLLVTGVYFLLVHFVVSPIRRISEQIRLAGRDVDDHGNEADAVVIEYKRVIDTLQQNKVELQRLNQEAEKRANSLERFNEYVLESVESGIITLDSDGNLLTANNAAHQMLTAEIHTGSKTSYQELFARCPELVKLIAESLRSGRVPAFVEVSFRDAVQPDRLFGAALSFIRDDKQRRVGLAILLNDLTELRRLHAMLEQKSRMAALGEMAAGLAHQIRNSLGAIGGFGRLICRRVDSEQVAANVAELMSEADDAEQLISRFLDFARPLQLMKSTLDIVLLLKEIMESFRLRPECVDTHFKLLAPESITVTADSLLLKQALANIIDNGVQACPAGKGSVVVKIYSETEGSQIVIKIIDSGRGIAEGEFDKLFTPFYSSRPAGTGLGLSIASRIVDLHGGTISVDSAPGEGTTFSIRLPRSPMDRKAESPAGLITAQ